MHDVFMQIRHWVFLSKTHFLSKFDSHWDLKFSIKKLDVFMKIQQWFFFKFDTDLSFQLLYVLIKICHRVSLFKNSIFLCDTEFCFKKLWPNFSFQTVEVYMKIWHGISIWKAHFSSKFDTEFCFHNFNIFIKIRHLV